MRYLLFICLFVGHLDPLLANPFEENLKKEKVDYDSAPNRLPIGLNFQVLNESMLVDLGVKNQKSALMINSFKSAALWFQEEIKKLNKLNKQLSIMHLEKLSLYADSFEGAKKLGFKIGDIITHLNGDPIHNVEHWEQLVDYAKPSSSVEIRALRNGKVMSFKLYRAHAFGFKVKEAAGIGYSLLSIKSLIDKEMKGCLIDSIDGIKQRDINYNKVMLSSGGMFMMRCKSTPPHLKKINKKKFFGIWSFMAYPLGGKYL